MQSRAVRISSFGEMKKDCPTLDMVIELALQAGSLLRFAFGKNHTVRHKGRIDLVTEMDQRCEDLILGQIRKLFPHHTVISEESGLSNGSVDSCWYVDPLDGTTNYAHGLPFFAVSIGFADQDGLKLGAIYDPMRDEYFYAEKGKGAYLNGNPIHVSDADQLVDCLLVTGFPYEVDEVYRWNLENFSRFATRTQSVRRLGSAALDFCYVAAGRVDGYWEVHLKPWDLAAGILIAQEAGAVVTDLNGDSEVMKPPYAHLTAAPKIHPLMLEILNTGAIPKMR